jgi:dCMP deaminase
MTSSRGDVVRKTWDATWMTVAQVIAQRSLCVRDQVGAVIVSTQNRIVASGYNGPPAGFPHNDKPCTEWCSRSTQRCVCRHTRDRHNGAHESPTACNLCGCWGYDPVGSNLDPVYADCPALHAEANALSVCERTVREGGTIYVSSGTCFGCAKLIANSGLAMLVVPKPNGEHVHRDLNRSYDFLEQCGVDVVTR